MTPDRLLKRVVVERLDWVDRMVAEIEALPLQSRDQFFADSRNVWTAESCLRRALEALLDLGRHILAKGFGVGTTEYKEIAAQLGQQRVLSADDAELLRVLAGYRNRMVHFYHEISPEELYSICRDQLGDVVTIRQAFQAWLQAHPQRLDEQL